MLALSFGVKNDYPPPWTVLDNHFLLRNFIIATISVSNAMMSIPKSIIKDKASVTVIIRLPPFLCNIVKESSPPSIVREKGKHT